MLPEKGNFKKHYNLNYKSTIFLKNIKVTSYSKQYTQ